MKDKTNLIAFLIVLLSLFLNLYGINWGLPDEERINMVFKNKEVVEVMSTKMKELRDEFYKIFMSREEKNMEYKDYPLKFRVGNSEIITSRYFLDSIRQYLLQTYSVDEPHAIVCVSKMNPEKLDFNPHYFVYGGLYIYSLAASLKVASLFHLIELKPDLEYYFLHPQELGKMYIIGRVMGAVFCSLAIFLIYLIGSLLYNKRTGIISALFFAITPSIVIWSHYLKPFAFTLFWMLLSFYFAAKILKTETKQLRFYILSGLFAGFAAGSLISYGYVLLLIPLAHLLRNKSGKKGKALFFFSLFDKEVLFGLLFFAIGFIIVNPYLLISFKEILREYKLLTQCWKFIPAMNNWINYFAFSLRTGFGLPLLITITAGIIYSLFKRRKEDILILIPLFIFYIYFSSSTPGYIHYGMSLIPFFILLAGRIISEGLSKKKWLYLISFLYLVFTLFYTFSYTFSYDLIFGEKNTKTIAGEWINENIPKGSSVGLYYWPCPTIIPPFSFFDYQLKITGYEKNLIEKMKPKYFCYGPLSYYCEDLPFALNKYKVIKKIGKIPTFFGLKFKPIKNSPVDWGILNPSFLILKRME